MRGDTLATKLLASAVVAAGAAFASGAPASGTPALTLTVVFAAPLVLGPWGFVGALVGVLASNLAGPLPLAWALLHAVAATVPAAAGAALLRLDAPLRAGRSFVRAMGCTLAVAATATITFALRGEPMAWADAVRAFPGLLVAAGIPVATVLATRAGASAEEDRGRFLATILENLPAVVFMKDTRGRYSVVNRSFEVFVGRGREEILGRTDEELFSAEIAERFKREDGKVFATRSVVEVEQMIPRDDRPHTFLVSKFPLIGPDGVPRSVGGVASDITEIHRLTRAVQDSEARLRDVIEHSTNMFYAHDLEQVFTYMSPQSRHFFGCDPDEAKVRWTDFVPDSASNRLAMEATERAIRTRQRQPAYEIEVRSRSGDPLWVEVNEAPVVRDGRVVAIVGALTDIDERRRAEHGRLRALSLLEATLEASGEGLVVVDRARRLAGFNQRYIAMWRIPAEVLETGDHELGVQHAEDQLLDPEGFAVRIREIYTRPEEDSFDVLHLQDGRILERYSRPQRLDAEVVGRVWSFRDVTAQRRAEEELLQHRDHLAELVSERTRELSQTNRDLETFCYTVSHDLRAPLRAIDGFSQILVQDEQDALSASSRKNLGRIRAAVGRMAQLIDDLLRLSRVSRCALRCERVDLGALASSIVADLRVADPTRDVVVTVETALTAEGDGTLLRSALQNLLENAWKFSSGRRPAHITFGARTEGGERVFFVRDDGAGFDMAHAVRLFAPFERLHGTHEFEGTGIGLATVQRIVQRHGGRIWAQGMVGHGATFFFTLAPDAVAVG
ncbi:MAG: PAS domain S-box protein [Myxococcota bacterium]